MKQSVINQNALPSGGAYFKGINKMSTSYYKLKKPVTSIRPEVLGGHTHIGIWINHGKSGTLVFRNEEWANAIWLFVDNENSESFHSYWGGKDCGTIIQELEENIPDEQQFVSEYGELLTAKEIRARQGAKRKDGFPTELFGFE